MSDLNATYPIGTLTTYYCPDGVQKYAICDANGEWSHEDLSTCELSGPDPYVEQNEPLPTPEGCDHIPANLGATVTVGELWQYGLWSFQAGGTKLERFLHENQHTQRKLLNFEFWINGSCQN